MEKNIHDDPLDDYVRRSFDDHEELPAADMWSRIESDLEPVPAPAWRIFFLRHRLRLAAAAILLLLSGLVCEHFYYENKLRDLVRQTDAPDMRQTATPPAINRSNTVQPDHARSIHLQPTPQASASDAAEFIRNSRVGGSSRATAITPPQAGQRAIVLATSPSEQGQNPDTPLPLHTPPPLFENQAQTLNQAPLPAGGEPVPYFSREVGGGAEHAVATAPIELLPLPENQPKPLDQAPLPAGGEPVPHFSREVGGGVPARTLSGWHLGIQATPHRNFEAATTSAHRPGMRPVFTSQAEQPDVTTDWWLRVGKSTGKRFGLESGIGFSENTRTTAHTARFRFADGAIHPGGPGPVGQRRNFSYDLSAWGGSASVSLRMESADASAPVAEAEPVVVKISTTEHTQQLRIPLLLTYRMGNGRLTAVAKAGLTGNYFLKNDLTVGARTSQNNRLRFAQNTDNFVFERSGNFFLGYWASAGLEYRWSRRLSLVAEPAVSGNFARKDAQGRRLPDQVLAGVNVGVNWRM